MSGVKRKKVKANAYWSFHQELIRSPELAGLSKEAQEKEIGKKWSLMNPKKKEVYKELAKKWNGNNDTPKRSSSYREDSPGVVRFSFRDQTHPPQAKKVKIEGLKDSLGESIEERERKVVDFKAYKKRMDQKVVEIIDTAVENEVFNTTNFHFIATQHFYETEGYSPNDFYPAEIAIAKFNLLDGIHARFHTKINPGPLPMGAAYEAGRKSEREHKYPVPTENDTDITNYVDLVQQILNFVLPEKDLPIFYTRDNDVFHVKTILNTIFAKCGEGQETLDAIHVYSTERLFHRLHKKSTELFNIGIDPSSKDFKMPMLSDPYALLEFRREFEAIEACDFHLSNDKLSHCALARVNGMGYLIANNCCDKRHLEMIEGRHKAHSMKTQQAREDFWF